MDCAGIPGGYYITDWTANNQIRRDRHHPSIYAPCLPEPAADGSQMSPNLATEYRLGKDSIGKAREEEERIEKISADQDSSEAVGISFRESTYAQVPAHLRKNHIPLNPITSHTQGWLGSAGQPVQDWTDCILLWQRDRIRMPAEVKKRSAGHHGQQSVRIFSYI